MISNEMIRKLEFYQSNKKVIHISCKSNRWYNGIILEINKEKNYIIFRDNLLGEVPIMFEEIYDVEPYVDENTVSENKEKKYKGVYKRGGRGR